MSNQSPQLLFIYITECTRFLYWSCFKPFTFKQYLEDVNPKLNIFTNPLQYAQDFETRPKLQRYARQVAWINAIAPFFIVLFIAISYSLFSNREFQWYPTVLYFMGWWIGIIVLVSYPALQNKIESFLRIIVTLIAVTAVIANFFGLVNINSVDQVTIPIVILIGAVLSVMFSMSGGVLGVMIGVLTGLMFATTLGLMGALVGAAIIVGLLFSVLFSVLRFEKILGGTLGKVIISILASLFFAVVSSILSNISDGIIVFIVTLLTIFRVYFWLPELIWTAALAWLSPSPAKSLRFLPPYFDEVMELPLPFMSRLIIRAYHEDPIAANETLYYLTHYTNQQNVAENVKGELIADIVFRCKTAQEISLLSELLPWDTIPESQIASSDKVLIYYLKISEVVHSSINASSVKQQTEGIKKSLTMLEDVQNEFSDNETNIEINHHWQSILKEYLSLIQQSKVE